LRTKNKYFPFEKRYVYLEEKENVGNALIKAYRTEYEKTAYF
jgi:hypothetical protein